MRTSQQQVSVGAGWFNGIRAQSQTIAPEGFLKRQVQYGQ